MNPIMAILSSPSQPESLTPEQALQLAIVRHQAGQLQDAERLYRAVLNVQPNHPGCEPQSGCVGSSSRSALCRAGSLQAALHANRNKAQYWLSYVNALMQAAR